MNDIQARRLCATENLQRSDLSAIEEVSALVDIVDTELLDEFGKEYADYGNASVERVRFVLTKLDNDRRADTDYFSHKFMGKIESIFSGLPKPKEWRSLFVNDLPLLTSTDEDVQQIAVDARLNKSQTKALQKLKEANWRVATHKTFEDYCQARFGFVRRQIDRKIGFKNLLEDLRPRGLKSLPATERQARPLTTLPTPEAQAQAWEKAQADSGKVLPAHAWEKRVSDSWRWVASRATRARVGETSADFFAVPGLLCYPRTRGRNKTTAIGQLAGIVLPAHAWEKRC